MVRDRDEDGETAGEGGVDRVEHLLRLSLALGQQRIDEQRRVAGLGREARNLGAELAGMPLRMPSRPAPEAFGELLHRWHYNRLVGIDGYDPH